MDQSSLLRFPATALHKVQHLARWLRSTLGTFFSQNRVKHVTHGAQTGAIDKRRHPRVTLHNIPVHVTDGCLFATAMLENISPDGICLRSLPEQLYINAGKLTVFSSNNPGLPVLQIEPRWQKSGWGGKTLGAVILNTTDAWRLFFVHTAGQLSL